MVVTESGVLLGDLRGKALQADPSKRVEEVMNPSPSTYRPNVSVHEMAHELQESGAHRVLVTDNDGRLIGWISRDDVELALDAQRRDNGPILASPR